MRPVACGDDDDATTGSPSAPADGEAGDDEAGDDEQSAGDFCGEYIALVAGDPEPDDIRAVAEIAPADAKEPMEVLATGFEEDEDFFETEEFETSYAAVNEIAIEECADDEMSVTARDYSFEGVESELSAGVYGVTFQNEGAELHEFFVMRKNDDTTQSWDELLEMEEEEAMELVTEIGGSFAMPGGSNPTLLDLSEPGEYIAVCFIPVGSTPDAEEESEGPPHFTQGTQSQFTVS